MQMSGTFCVEAFPTYQYGSTRLDQEKPKSFPRSAIVVLEYSFALVDAALTCP
jgi:hypothetical protein